MGLKSSNFLGNTRFIGEFEKSKKRKYPFYPFLTAQSGNKWQHEKSFD